MDSEYAKSERENIEKYQAKGYTINFNVVNDKLIDVSTKKEYKAADVFIIKEYRYEGMSNPSDMSILYIIETRNQDKGTALIGYGPSGDLNAAEFFKAIPKSNYKE